MKLTKIIPLIAVAALFGWNTSAQNYDTNGDYVQTFAGSGISGYLDGQGQLTKFSNPSQIVADTSSNLYVWDSGNYLIRKITPTATVSTLAGGGFDFEGYGTNVSFSYYSIGTMAIDHANTIWLVASFYSAYYFLNIATNGYVTIQNGGYGLTNLSTSSGICFDSANTLYYSGGNRIWRYNPASGIPQVFAGNGTSGWLDGNGTVFTEFSSPSYLVADAADNIYVEDGGGSRLRRIDQSQNVTTVTNVSLGNPMCVDNNGNIVFVNGNSITKLTVKTNVLIYAGTTSFSSGTYTNGAGNLARFNNPSGACLSQGSVFVADTGNQRIRQISFNPQPQVVSGANLGIGTFAGVTITGAVGRTYQIQTSPDMNTWTTRATLLLTSSPYLWIDQNPVSGNKFYRAVLLP
jgi:hypothetical protein